MGMNIAVSCAAHTVVGVICVGVLPTDMCMIITVACLSNQLGRCNLFMLFSRTSPALCSQAPLRALLTPPDHL